MKEIVLPSHHINPSHMLVFGSFYTLDIRHRSSPTKIFDQKVFLRKSFHLFSLSTKLS